MHSFVNVNNSLLYIHTYIYIVYILSYCVYIYIHFNETNTDVLKI